MTVTEMAAHCFLFDPRLGSEETAERKILCYHPPTTPLTEQVSAVGLCEAITGFSRTFAHDGDGTTAVHTQRGRQVSLEAEPSIWIVLTMPHAPAAADKKEVAAAAEKRDAGAEDELPAAEEALQDSTLFALLRRLYSMLRLACGPLSAIAASRGADTLCALLGEVLPLLVRLLLPPGEEDGRRLDLLDTLEGMCARAKRPPPHPTPPSASSAPPTTCPL